MINSTMLNGLNQLESNEIEESFADVIRQVVRETIVKTFTEEVTALCGAKHEQGVKRGIYRNGSTDVNYSIFGSSESIKKPRVRKCKTDGKDEEFPLSTHKEIKNAVDLQSLILQMVTHGVSCRDVGTVLNKQKTTSKSNASRLMAAEGAKQLDIFRSRDLAKHAFIALTLDGIYLSSDICVIAALGITESGHKIFLDFEVGSSENSSTASTLMGRICERGFHAPYGLLCSLDGSKALKKGVLKYFPNSIIQRCLIHKERNIKGRLARKYWGELAKLFKELRTSQGKEAGQEKLNNLKKFLKERNKLSYDSLLEAEDEMIAVHNLNISSSLNPSLLNTNIIENSFRNVRRKIGRVARWRPETNQPSNWMALAISHIEKGFRRIRGYQEIESLKVALLAIGTEKK
jgi:putative transposase